MAYDTIKHGRVTWTNIIRPTAEDIARLGEAYPQFHPLNLDDALNPNERPKIDEYPDHLFIVMHFPLWDEHEKVSRPSEVHFFIGHGFLVTIHDNELKPSARIFEECKEDAEARRGYIGKTSGHLLHTLIDALVDFLFPVLEIVESKIGAIESNLFSHDIRGTIVGISLVRRDIIALRRTIRPQLEIVSNIASVSRPFIHKELDVYFDDILDHLKRAHDILEEDSDIIASLADTNNMLSSYGINEIIRILTIISVVILPLTLLAGLYGMNVRLPLETHPQAFWIVAGIMLAVSVLMLVVFRFRRWL